MELAESKLDKIGEQIRAALLAEETAREEIHHARIGFLEQVASRNAAATRQGWPHRRSGRFYLRTLILATAATAGATGIWLWTQLPISFQVGVAGTPGRVDDLIDSVGTEPTPLKFSEGSSLLLHQGSRMRLLSLDTHGARVLVEDGVLEVNIASQKASKANWNFEAGPFHVRVTGTKFQMTFHMSDQSFSLATQEGQVMVSGACLKTPKTVSAGERLALSCLPKASSLDVANTDIPLQPLSDTVTGGTSLDRPSQKNNLWRDLLAAGRLQEGLHAAERVNFNRVCQIATPKELLSLADGARLFGSTTRAMHSLRVLRRRFPGSSDAATAAFTLGRIAFERQNDYSEAVDWFSTYLREQPSGPLMGDSFGRLMEARLRSGDQRGARVDAEQYLRRFPEGPYASVARGILSK